HRRTAENHGAAGLPPPVKTLMRMTSKVMTTTAYRL
ncbi:MAG: demethoxyubiquinone hydroxylase family protein, partial [Alcaligenes sp.]